jgi:hypothetical protein
VGQPTTPGCSLPPDTPVEGARGKIVSAKGTFATATRRTMPGRTHASPIAFYTMPSALESLRASRGVVVTGPRFQGETFAGHESPGPIFFPDAPRHVRGGTMAGSERFPAPRPSRGASSGIVVSSPQFGHSNAAIGGSPSGAHSVASGNQSRASSATRRCTFGVRPLKTNSPWTEASSDATHSYLPADDGHRIVGGVLGTAPKVSSFAGAADAADTPGPNHFHVPTRIGEGRGFFVGRRLRAPPSLTPGPGAYDVGLAEDRLRRKRR